MATNMGTATVKLMDLPEMLGVLERVRKVIDFLEAENKRLEAENKRLREIVLSAAGDDLCRLTQEEIKDLSLGVVKIPPKEEFIASCSRFHAQIAKESGGVRGWQNHYTA